MYTGALFRASLRYARTLRPDLILILSAKFGVLPLDREIEPYDLTLTKMNAPERHAWAKRVMEQICRISDPSTDQFIVLAGARYADGLLPYLKHATQPLDNLPLGKRLQFLKEAAAKACSGFLECTVRTVC